MAKTGILATSQLAGLTGLAGFIWLYLVSKPTLPEDNALDQRR